MLSFLFSAVVALLSLSSVSSLPLNPSLVSTPVNAPQVGAHLSLYQDKTCAMQIGEDISLPLPFSASCQALPSNPPLSIIFNCVYDTKSYDFKFQIYNGTADCSGPLTAGITSKGDTGSCAAATVAEGDTSLNAFAKVDCTSAVAASSAVETVENVAEKISWLTTSQYNAPAPAATSFQQVLRKMKAQH